MPKAKKQVKTKRVTTAMLLDAINGLGDLLVKTINEVREQQTTRNTETVYIGHKSTEEMFAELRSVNLPRSTRLFIDDLEYGFDQYGSLTSAQFECLERNYKKFIHGISFRSR